MKNLKEILESHERIVCLLAIYEKSYGNCTKVMFHNGNEILLKQSTESVIRAIAKHYALDLKELRKKEQKLINSTYQVPLPINKDMLFISIKTRLPMVKKDSCSSYVNFYEIDKLDKKSPIIYMKNGQEIKSLNSLKTVKKRYHDGEVSAKFQINGQVSPFRVSEDSVHYLYPATKGDIKAISREIEELRDLVRRILVSEKG